MKYYLNKFNMLKKGIIILFIFLWLYNYSYCNNYIDKIVDWYRFRYLKYDTTSDEYIFKIWVNKDYSATSLRELMENNNWVSAINGVYFCPADYKECGWKDFTKNERFINWEKIGSTTSTQERVVFAVDENNNPFLFQTDYINKTDEHKIYYWLANFPLLLLEWESKYEDYVDLWLIDYKMELKWQRNFICSDKENKYIFNWFVSNIYLKDLPEQLIKIGCYNAINLDAWYSSAMIYNSKYIIWPWRKILDWIIIEKKWLDTKEIINYAEDTILFIEKKLKNKSYEYRIDYIWKFITNLNQIKSNIYEKNSIDLYDEESWEVIWYEINVKSNNLLEILYFNNYLIKNLKELEDWYIKEQKIIDDKQNLLF